MAVQPRALVCQVFFASLAQWQSEKLLTSGSQVRVLDEAPNNFMDGEQVWRLRAVEARENWVRFLGHPPNTQGYGFHCSLFWEGPVGSSPKGPWVI